ncbi:hypothetical protein GQ600_12357 [Phytophthora cactorum]|nr:hypothetical protein GQ600_12357 [Phytophthora cactorum]
MGACLSKCPIRENNACDVVPNGSPTKSAVPSGAGSSKNLVARFPAPTTKNREIQCHSENSLVKVSKFLNEAPCLRLEGSTARIQLQKFL